MRFTTLIVFASACSTFAALGAGLSTPLNSAKETGRQKSRFLQAGTAGSPSVVESSPGASSTDFKQSVNPILTKSCVGCHGPKKSEGRLRIDQLNSDLLNGPDAERWREVYNALIKAEMPPEDSPDPQVSDSERGTVISWLSEQLHRASIAKRSSKEHSSFRRLTRYEYDYALQDLLGIPFPLASKLPLETTSEDGFKNRSDLLQVSAMQFESYREIGLKALRRATVIGEKPQPVTYTVSMREEFEKAQKSISAKNDKASDNVPKKQDKNAGNLKKQKSETHLLDRDTGLTTPLPSIKLAPLTGSPVPFKPGSTPAVLILPRSNELKLDLDRFLPDAGVMRVKIHAARSSLNPDEHAGLRLIFSAHTSNNANFSEVVSKDDMPVTAPAGASQVIEFDIPLEDIQRNPFRKLSTPFPRRDEFLHIRNISNSNGAQEPLHVLIDHVEITAPFYEQWPPKSHTEIFIASTNKSDEQLYGREVLGRFLRRAWRRPVTPSEIDQYMGLFSKYRPSFDTFEEAMIEVLATALASPDFLYLPHRKTPNQTGISDLEFASRLAVFLWSSIPDEELISLAEAGKLRHPGQIESQIKRMLADPRSKRFSQNFVEQWLGLDKINSVTHIPDSSLKDAMLAEPVALFEEVLHNQSSILDFIDCDYALVNERLAAHYRIPNVYGPHFRKVSIDQKTSRGGLLTSAAVLAINSDGKDSHPVKRGVWLLQRVLHDPPPPPPPNVPEVDLTDPEILKMTLKERIVNHRNHPACTSCHTRIDPWGIAFENYDALGVFRTQIQNRPVDATSELFNHQTLAGVEGLKHYLLTDRQDQFARALTHKMTAYALGRPLSFGDRADIDQLTSQLRKAEDRLGDLIQIIVRSDIFSSN